MICLCVRCNDPTEMGLYVGSWCCSFCKAKGAKSMVLPISPLLQPTLAWKCETCGQAPTKMDVLRNITMPRELEAIMAAGGTTSELEEFIAKHLYPKGYAHPTHETILKAKAALIKALTERQKDVTRYGISRKDWQTFDRRMALCEDILKVLDVLNPGHFLLPTHYMARFFEAAVSAIDFGVPEFMTMQQAKDLKERCRGYLKRIKECLITEKERKEFYRVSEGFA